ncbi:maleylpyruvate isomerase [Sulfitobacter sp. M57]|uniref:maleylpyruvate isomerase N-terminal domain-containing protein n=1 Tax=unclassified Sulfitobacter TaxID=196795 RepID=UPI0023E098D1|nr:MULTISPECIES: maleylpyruvate isomerase N-terminal domain-containing protein [unclassified Sulfitobacter]MDF3416315.1 maleylpyruvate isomerase [Sulfitobacter sp. KE5]MDF3423794.1 maleylpyruvate isomerase [Sulfitobacter sp. KE43]MDF3434861.1 maleylpyruvate isomerase [Sulfitobacter sp. KE42]MDF3460500.1 maleylpyruvate isomerase [Sulfitobacter sp. S74]MDF3464398.1 maleylpyruvate isomerase [Sulfitobacter sp. Ks18]
MPFSEAEEAARAALRDRQGKGARYDAASAPHEDLLLARRGTAFFARKLMELSDTDLYCPSAVEGHSRAHVVTSISFSARRQALMLEAFHNGDIGTISADQEQHFSDLDLAATLPPRAIRHLFRHSEVHLNVCWRDLSEAEWDMPLAQVHTPGLTPRQLPRLRATQIWQAAISLGNGASARDMPVGL